MIQTLVSKRGGRVDGHVTFVVLGNIGHVRHLVIAPEAHRDVGHALMSSVAETLRARGITEWCVDVRVDDAHAIELHERLGMTVAHRSTVLDVSRVRLHELPREPATVLPVDPVEDDDIERALDLPLGRIAMLRLPRARKLVQLRDARFAPVGFAAFDPVNGAVQFRVARPALAASLLDAHRVHRLAIDDDPRTTSLLVAAGAEPTLELLHYQGTLVAPALVAC